MIKVSLAQARIRLSELIQIVEAGEEVIITRYGQTVAHIIRASRPKRPLPLDDLAAFRASMPRLRRSSVALLRAARNEER